MYPISSDCFFKDRIHIQRMSKINRNDLFVEVSQKDLIMNIFDPLSKLINNETEQAANFFGKRLAILGDFKIGKTELGKCINNKLESYYDEIVILTINSKMAQYLGVKEIDDWIYNQWLIHLTQVDNIDFKKIVLSEINEFEEERSYHPLDKDLINYLEKLHLICRIYKKYLEIVPEAKFVVEFDQANVITDEGQFTPFYEFWRNFQGYWEDENYFAELPLFICVIGHKDWENFAALKTKAGRGVFDKRITYHHWDITDIYQLFEKRLKHAIKPEFHEELLGYFLCPGIVDFFGKKLGEASTQEYIDSFFGDYLTKFIENYVYNYEKFKDFLDFCRKDTRKQKYESTFFNDIERVFSGTPALDYMQVFKFLRENEIKPWFEEIFDLIQVLYDKTFISFDSKGLKNYKVLTYKLIYENFSFSALSNMIPRYNPPLFHDYGGKLALDSAFKRCLDAIPQGKRGSVYRLKRFIKSERIEHEIFDEETNGKEMKKELNNAQRKTNEILYIIQEWYINQYLGIIDENTKLNSNNLIPFDMIRKKIVKLNNLYKGSTTNWALFDREAREIPDLFFGKYFPKNCIFIGFLNIKSLKIIKEDIISPKTSNIIMIRLINKFLDNYISQLKDFDITIKKKNQTRDPIKELIALGETFNSEFKSSLRYDYYQKKLNKDLEMEIAKTIIAFLNSEGGRLFIGVKDNGEILGLANDYLTLKRKNRDGFKLKLVEIINNYIGREFNRISIIKFNFEKVENKEICVIEVKKYNKEVYLKKKEKEVLVIRTEASSIELNTREAVEYIREHWKKRPKA